jgi:hypothetical protein
MKKILSILYERKAELDGERHELHTYIESGDYRFKAREKKQAF